MSVILGNYNKKKTPKISKDGYVQCLPPDNDIPPGWSANEYRIFTNKKKNGEITEWRNENGDITHYTERKYLKGKKQLVPFTYWTKTTEDGKLIGIWKQKGWLGTKCFNKSHKISKSDLPIMIVEGEKCMHFAENNPFLSEQYLATTWYGGVENLFDFNFEIFKDKEVMLCPDNDEPGRKAMHSLAYQLITKGITENIKYFNLADRFSEHFPSAWDIADDFPENYNIEETLAPQSMFIAQYKDVKDNELWKEIEEEEEKRIEKQTAKNLMTSYCYVMANDMFNKLGSKEFYQKQQLNNYHKHQVKSGLTDVLLKDPDFAKAETFITSAQFKPGLIKITRPGIIPLINNGVVLNIYIPNYLTEKKGDVEFLIEFFIWLIGEEKWRIIEKWIAYMLIYPGEKIKWSIVLVSAVEGVGKGLLARILSRILGSDNVNENANYKHLANTHNTLLIGKQVVVLNELSLGDFKSKNEGTNTLKNFVGDDTYSCNFKGKPMVILPNLTNFMLFSNDEAVLGLKQGVRRYFFCNITKTEEEIIKKTDEGLFKRAWDFVDSDEGASALIYYFKKEVDMTDTDMFKMRAPETDDLKQLIEQSKHPLQKKLEHDLHRPDLMNRKIFSGRWCGLITFNELNEALNTYDKEETRNYNWGTFGDDAILKFLSANAIRWNNGEATRQIEINRVRNRFYNLDDTRCPIPDKSYKDLTPKQIEVIYNDYLGVRREIEEEEPQYINAKRNIEHYIREYKEKIELWKDLKTKNKKHFKSKSTEQIYEEIMNGSIPMEGNDNHDKERIKNAEKRIQRGIRTPTQILEERIKPKPNGIGQEDLKKDPTDPNGLSPAKRKVSLNL
ncbi:MAG: hypothetical protein H8E55_62335 [Pelagibacterales bacterium]|nr:hypothetical protein [Pelagibacterales bacterium]